MTTWPDRRALDLFRIEVPIVQAPMAGSTGVEMVLAVSAAGGLGSLPMALLSAADADAALVAIRAQSSRPINVNFFCHTMPVADAARETAWRAALAPYYRELGIDASPSGASRRPFDEAGLAFVEKHRPEVVSFHFGLPTPELVARVKATGAVVISSATTAAEARWLEARGADAIIAMGAEAGGHRGSFLTEDMATQVGTFALVPQVVDAVKVPVIAAGGIADGRGIAAAFALGASGVQVGTAYLRCDEARISPTHRAALDVARDDSTVLTNVFTGRPARGIANRLVRELGPLSPLAPAFPLASAAIGSLAKSAPADFGNQWAGQAVALGRSGSAEALTRRLTDEALAALDKLSK